jgi:hydroxymethylglutaryl-CoA lyase
MTSSPPERHLNRTTRAAFVIPRGATNVVRLSRLDTLAGVATPAAGSLQLPPTIDVREVGMRDGLQLESPLPLDAKLRMLAAIVATGVRRIEVTSFVSPRAVPALADADALAAELGAWPDVHFSALVANPRGAHRALEAGIPHLEYVVSAADSHSLANAGRTTAAACEAITEISGLAHAGGGSLEVIIATAWDCPFDGPTDPQRVLDVVAAALDQGADRLCLGDTIGTVTPARTVALLAAVRDAAPTLETGVHFHDTRGTGQANALAAILAGVRQLDASVGGLGGCPFAPGASGNIATEELVYWLEDAGVTTGIDLERTVAAAGVAQTEVGHPLTSSLLRAGGQPVPLGAWTPSSAP